MIVKETDFTKWGVEKKYSKIALSQFQLLRKLRCERGRWWSESWRKYAREGSNQQGGISVILPSLVRITAFMVHCLQSWCWLDGIRHQRYTQWYYSVCAVMYVAKMEDRMKEAKVVQNCHYWPAITTVCYSCLMKGILCSQSWLLGWLDNWIKGLSVCVLVRN